MRIAWTLGLVAVATAVGASSASAKATRFWNLTDNTITDFRLAPAGTDKYGPNQTLNDKDKSVDHDERLKILDVPTGTYDARFTDSRGRTCTVKGVSVKDGDVFSIEEKQVAGCTKAGAP